MQRLATVPRVPLQPPKGGVWGMRHNFNLVEPKYVGMSLIHGHNTRPERIEHLGWPLLGDCHRSLEPERTVAPFSSAGTERDDDVSILKAQDAVTAVT